MTTIEAIAELIHGKIQPQPGDENKIEIEDIIESAKNAYQNIVWELYMDAFRNDGDRTIFEGMLKNRSYPVENSNELDIADINIVTLPRDAGLHSVMPVDHNNAPAGFPFIKTTVPNSAKNRFINTGPRYYRVGDKIIFPDGIPQCVGYFHVFYAGTSEDDLTMIPRDIADLVEQKLERKYLPSTQIPSDVNKNLQPGT